MLGYQTRQQDGLDFALPLFGVTLSFHWNQESMKLQVMSNDLFHTCALSAIVCWCTQLQDFLTGFLVAPGAACRVASLEIPKDA